MFSFEEDIDQILESSDTILKAKIEEGKKCIFI